LGRTKLCKTGLRGRKLKGEKARKKERERNIRSLPKKHLGGGRGKPRTGEGSREYPEKLQR